MSDPPVTRRPVVLLAVLFGMFASAIEMNIVATAMPRIVGTLGGSDRFAWITSIYLLTTAIAAPLSGKLADLYGRKPVYQAGMALFLVGSALCGAAPTMTALIAARGLQGLGGGAVATVALTLLGDLYTPVERGRMQGLLSAVWGTAGALGPLAGGFIVDHLGWRWVFYLTLLPGVVAIMVLSGALHERIERRKATLDLPGAIVLTLAVLALQSSVGGAEGSASAGSIDVKLALAGAALMALFVRVESRAKEPMLPPKLLADRRIGPALLTSLLAGVVMFGVMNFVPLYLQSVMGRSARDAGIAMTPFGVAWPVAAVVAGLLIARVSVRTMAQLGMGLVTLGTVLLTLLDVAAPDWLLTVAVTLVGTGMGIATTPLLIGLQSAVDWDQRGVVTAAFSFCRTIGGTLGMVLAGTLLLERLKAAGVSPAQVDALLRPGASLGGTLIRTALDRAVHGVMVSVAIGGLASFATTFTLARSAKGAHEQDHAIIESSGH